MRGVSVGRKGELTNFVLALNTKPNSGFPSSVAREEQYWIGGAFACHGQGRQGLGRRKGEHAMVTVPGHSSFFFSIFCQTRLDFGSSAIVGNHSIAYKMPILGLKSIAKDYQMARSRKLLRVPCQNHFKMFSIPVGLSCDQARLPRKGHEAAVVG